MTVRSAGSQINVKEVDITTTILGTLSSLPLYITATALGKLAHPDGEVRGPLHSCLTLPPARGAGSVPTVFCVQLGVATLISR